MHIQTNAHIYKYTVYEHNINIDNTIFSLMPITEYSNFKYNCSCTHRNGINLNNVKNNYQILDLFYYYQL